MDPRLAAGFLLAGIAWATAFGGTAQRWWDGRDGVPAWSPAPSFAGSVEVTGAVRYPGVQFDMAGRPLLDALDAAGPKVSPAGEILLSVLFEGALIDLDETGVVSVRRMAGERLLALDLRINLLNASERDLQALPGIGPVTAARIVLWRAARGRIESIDALDEVRGIGPKTLARVKPFLKIGNSADSTASPRLSGP
jgi:competence protein ComEA